MLALEVFHRGAGGWAKIAVVLQRTALVLVADCGQFALDSSYFGPFAADPQDYVRYMVAREMLHRFTRLFQGAMGNGYSVGFENCVCVRQVLQRSFLTGKARFQGSMQFGRMAKQRGDMGTLVVLHGIDNIVVAQLREVVVGAELFAQSLIEDARRQVAKLHRRAPYGVLHRHISIRQVQTAGLQCGNLSAVVRAPDEIVLIFSKARIGACQLSPHGIELWSGGCKSVELFAVRRLLQILMQGAGDA